MGGHDVHDPERNGALMQILIATDAREATAALALDDPDLGRAIILRSVSYAELYI